MTIKIYHNPRCSKSRQTLGLLESNDCSPEIIKYLEVPPRKSRLKKIIHLLGVSPTDIIRFKEKTAKELGIHPNDQRSDAQWIELIINNPILMERPIVFSEESAIIGRPPERVLAFIEAL